MSLQRKVQRTILKKQWKDHNKGIAKRYRTPFKDFWKWFQKEGKGVKLNG